MRGEEGNTIPDVAMISFAGPKHVGGGGEVGIVLARRLSDATLSGVLRGSPASLCILSGSVSTSR